jgi:hypothetical protein
VSYCRFSTDDFRCDLYLYQDVQGGYTLHVAANREVGEIPRVPSVGKCSKEEWIEANRRQIDFLMTCERRPIGLGHDGACFRMQDLAEVLATVRMLAAAGYRVPDYLIRDLEVEEELGWPTEARTA